MGLAVSVVVPCRNARAWVEEAVRSALSQTGVELEVIVVDDGSDDGSPDAVRGLDDGRVRLVEQEAAHGVSRARTEGTTHARGRHLQYLDADDVLLPGALAARVAALDGTGADVAYSDWVRYERDMHGVFRDGEMMAHRLGPRPDIDLFTDRWWPPGALLYRRTLVERIGPWREDLPVIQDARFLLDAALLGGRFTHAPGVGLRYRVHGLDSLSRRDPRAFVADCYRNARDLHERWAREDTLDVERRRALLRVYGYVARAAFGLDRAWFREVVRHLYALDPSYRPERPRALRLVSGLVGYPAAERVALAYRSARRRLNRGA